MTITAKTRAHRVVTRIAATWSDLDHAQRRLLEIQTGRTGLTRQHDRRSRGRDGGPQ